MRRRDRAVLGTRVAYSLDSLYYSLREVVQSCPDCAKYPEWPYYLLCSVHSALARREA